MTFAESLQMFRSAPCESMRVYAQKCAMMSLACDGVAAMPSEVLEFDDYILAWDVRERLQIRTFFQQAVASGKYLATDYDHYVENWKYIRFITAQKWLENVRLYYKPSN